MMRRRRRRTVSSYPSIKPPYDHKIASWILGLLDFELPRFWASQNLSFPDFSSRIFNSRFLVSQILSFPDIGLPELWVSQILGFPDFGFPRVWVSQILGFPEVELPGFKPGFFPAGLMHMGCTGRGRSNGSGTWDDWGIGGEAVNTFRVLQTTKPSKLSISQF